MKISLHPRVLTFWGCAAIVLLCPYMAAMAEEAAEATEAAEAEVPAEVEVETGPPDVRQVQVKVWISETNEQGVRDIGANLEFTRFVRGEEQSGSVQQISTNTMNPSERFGTTNLPYPNVNLFGPPMRPGFTPGDGLQAVRGAGLEFSILSTDYGTIDGLFQSLERRADMDLISKPELMVANNMPATVRAGAQIPYQDVTYPKGVPELQVDWRDIGVNLALTPAIMPNDYIRLEIDELEVSDIARIDNLRGVDLPVFSSRSQTGVVFVPDGTTLVIGGLTSRAMRKTERRVPVLGSVPLLGIPFRSRKSDAEITSLLIFVSPTVVDLRAPTPQAKSALSFWRERGSEWVNMERIDREIEAMEAGL